MHQDVTVLATNEKFIPEFKKGFPENLARVKEVLTKILNKEVPLLLTEGTTEPGHQYPMKIVRKFYVSRG